MPSDAREWVTEAIACWPLPTLREPLMYDRHEMHTDVVDAIDALDWSQLEFGHTPETEAMVDAVVPIVWQAAIDFIYQQPMTLNRDTLIERMKRWMESDDE